MRLKNPRLCSRLILVAVFLLAAQKVNGEPFRLGTFTANVTIPLDHRCMGLLPIKSKTIVDPLYAHGFVLMGDGEPIVLCAVDWCEIRNGAYDLWRDEIAAAVGTSRHRVLVCALHQHDAPVVDSGAAQLLASVGLRGELYDEAFHDQTVKRVAAAARDCLADAVPVTHIGLGQARVKSVASNRRVVYPDGRINFDRGSRSGDNRKLADAPEGEIDPFLKTISFWHDDQPIVALHSYATHPMSYYGAGAVSSDFVGLAREQRRRDDFAVQQIYVSGCSGDITAGKFNDGSPEMRKELTDRVYRAMVTAWDDTKRQLLEQVNLRTAKLHLDYHPNPELSLGSLLHKLHDRSLTVEQRIHAAMSLSSRHRVASGQAIDLPCIDFGVAQIVLFPGEAFVRYQLMAQEMRPDSFVLSIGYGECWPGYIPTAQAFKEGFTDKWLWTAPGAEAEIRRALGEVLVEQEK